MYLTEIAKALVLSINSSSPENWGGSTGSGLVVPTDVTAKFALDPFSESGNSILDIYVIPGYIEYDRVGVRKRKLTADKKFVTVAIAAKIRAAGTSGDPVPTYDVTTESEAIKLVDLKEDLDFFLNNLQITGASLRDFDTEPIDELEMKDSFFIVTSVLGYDTC